jgi:hypothetical protein
MTSSTAPSTGLLAPYIRSRARRAALTEAIDAALALLVARGVPRQVVVDDRVEVVLQVHAFGQAVGRDEDPALGVAEQRRHAFFALHRRVLLP